MDTVFTDYCQHVLQIYRMPQKLFRNFPLIVLHFSENDFIFFLYSTVDHVIIRLLSVPFSNNCIKTNVEEEMFPDETFAICAC